MANKQSRRALTAPPTLVVFTQTTVDREIDRLWLRVQLRAAALGLTMRRVAYRMGISAQALAVMMRRRRISRDAFLRLSRALEGAGPPLEPWWLEPLPRGREISAEKVRESVRRKMR